MGREISGVGGDVGGVGRDVGGVGRNVGGFPAATDASAAEAAE